MISDKIKVRLSNFVLKIIENDCLCYGYIKSDNSPNKNEFLNKLIPNLVQLRKFRREKIKNYLNEDSNKKNSEEIYNSINYLIDQVYFYDAELEVLNGDIWIRPNKSSLEVFDDIENNETKITCLDVTNYIRGLLNEYARFPQYKRLSLLLEDELKIIEDAQINNRILNFRYEDEKYRIVVYNYLYGYITDQNSYVIGYEINKKQIRAFLLHKMKNIYQIQQKYKINKELEYLIEEYINNYEFVENRIIQIVEEKIEEK